MRLSTRHLEVARVGRADRLHSRKGYLEVWRMLFCVVGFCFFPFFLVQCSIEMKIRVQAFLISYFHVLCLFANIYPYVDSCQWKIIHVDKTIQNLPLHCRPITVYRIFPRSPTSGKYLWDQPPPPSSFPLTSASSVPPLIHSIDDK